VDLWGTLLLDRPGSDNRYRPQRLAAFDGILRGHGHAFPTSALERAYEDSALFLRRVWSANRDVPVSEHALAILRSLDRRLADAAGADLVEALVEAYAAPVLTVPPVFDDTAAAGLERLRARGVTLALVSNTMRTPGVVLRSLLDRAGLLACFAHATFSDELGIRKPAPEIFWEALRHVGGEAASTVHVGDDPILDVEGAHAAGFRAVQIVGARAGRPAPDADRTILCLGDLPAAIRSLEAD
jgi:putative hydrolase of the HAD superfamily